MTMKTPTVGDRVLMICGAMLPEETGTVIAECGTGWAHSWEVRLEDGSTTHISRYVGTAEDRGGYLVRREPANGIGTYVVTEVSK